MKSLAWIHLSLSKSEEILGILRELVRNVIFKQCYDPVYSLMYREMPDNKGEISKVIEKIRTKIEQN
jgi:hypothetical protein